MTDLDAERGIAQGGELTCKQAILEVLLSTRPPGARYDVDILAFAVYMQVRKKWRAVYESHTRSHTHEPPKVPHALPRDIAVPAAQRFVIWAMDRITQLQLQQHQFMQAQ